MTYVPSLRPKRVFRFPYILSLGRPPLFRLGHSFSHYDSGSLGLRSDSGVSELPLVREYVWSFRRGLVRSPGPIVVVPSPLGTRLSSDSCGLDRDSTDELSTSVVLALTWDT